MAYEPLVEEIGSLHRKVSMLEAKGNKPQDNDIYVENLDEIKLHLREELSRFGASLKQIIQSSKLPSFSISETIKLSNIGDLERALKNIANVADSLESKIGKINFEPNVNVTATIPEIKLPTINVPEIKAPNVTVNPIVDIDIASVIAALEPLRLLSKNADSPLSVRLSDGSKFYKMMKILKESTEQLERSTEQLGVVYSGGSSGMSSDEYRAQQLRLTKSTTATNTFATVGVASGTVAAANGSRISLTLVNDSLNKIYISKSATAVSGSGILLNASGGSLIIDDYTGIVSAIAAGASSNLTVCEVY